MAAHQFTVALVGPANMTGWVAEEEYEKPYRVRQTVTIRAADEDTLASVLERAAHHFGTVDSRYGWNSPYGIVFHREEDEGGGRWSNRRAANKLVVLDDQGRAKWRWWGGVSVQELLRSAAAGAVNGDPLRPYSVVEPHAAAPLAAPGVGWDEFVQMYEVFRQVAEVLAIPGGAYASYSVIKRLATRARAGSDALSRHGSRWGDAGADPDAFDEWLDDRPWLPSEVAELLGCPPPEAQAALWAFGFAPDSVGLWRRRQDKDAEFMDSSRGMLRDYLAGSMQRDAADLIERRIKRHAETGDPAKRI
jgi:hypothetical protein